MVPKLFGLIAIRTVLCKLFGLFAVQAVRQILEFLPFACWSEQPEQSSSEHLLFGVQWTLVPGFRENVPRKFLGFVVPVPVDLCPRPGLMGRAWSAFVRRLPPSQNDRPRPTTPARDYENSSFQPSISFKLFSKPF